MDTVPAGRIDSRLVIELIAVEGVTDLQPRITFSPVGHITQGWLQRHIPVLLRDIQRAQSAQGVEQERAAKIQKDAE